MNLVKSFTVVVVFFCNLNLDFCNKLLHLHSAKNCLIFSNFLVSKFYESGMTSEISNIFHPLIHTCTCVNQRVRNVKNLWNHCVLIKFTDQKVTEKLGNFSRNAAMNRTCRRETCDSTTNVVCNHDVIFREWEKNIR